PLGLAAEAVCLELFAAVRVAATLGDRGEHLKRYSQQSRSCTWVAGCMAGTRRRVVRGRAVAGMGTPTPVDGLPQWRQGRALYGQGQRRDMVTGRPPHPKRNGGRRCAFHHQPPSRSRTIAGLRVLDLYPI